MSYSRIIDSFSKLKGNEDWVQRRVRIPFNIKKWCKIQRIKDTQISNKKPTLKDMYLQMYLDGLEYWNKNRESIIFKRWDFKKLDKQETMFFPKNKHLDVQSIQNGIAEFGNEFEFNEAIVYADVKGDTRIIESIIVQFIELGYRLNIRAISLRINKTIKQ
jgi:hypothetical protein